MVLASKSQLVPIEAMLARRDILLWTTRDGREIPLDDMSDEHISNALRVLSVWRARLKKRAGDDQTISDLKEAITRFKGIQRRRRKIAEQATKNDGVADSKSGWTSGRSRKTGRDTAVSLDADPDSGSPSGAKPGTVRPNFKPQRASDDDAAQSSSTSPPVRSSFARSSSGFGRRRKPVANT